jgi:enoyl-CoA hydratase/carnithine racemase
MLTDKMVMEKRGSVGWMTFNNPAKLNAVSMEMWEASMSSKKMTTFVWS